MVGVKFPKASSIEFNSTGELFVGNFAVINSVATYADGKEKSDVKFSFKSSDPTVIVVDNLNNLKAIKKGSSVITASFDGHPATVLICRIAR